MTQVPDEPEVVLPEGGKWQRPHDDDLPRMVEEPEIVDPGELAEADGADADGADAADESADTVVQEPDVVRLERDE
ncbi:MAG: hypothetical protein DCC50_04130 [Acidobacteria bacterium]|nr:MAG: hypothetical protein DCC50_04130 [Acidobacteriota bacterium]